MTDHPDHEAPAEAPGRRGRDDEAAARAYEAAHNRLFVVQIALTILVLAVFFFSGASLQLAGGLRSRFDAWWAVNAVYLAVGTFGFSAVLFPLTYYSGHVLEQHYGLTRQSFGGWLWDYAKSLVLELLLGLVFFSFVYALLRWLPGGWWMAATAFYVIFAIALSALAPVWIMPLFHKFEPLEDAKLAGAVTDFAERAGLEVIGVYRWGLQEKTATANAALAGLGRTRRIILGDTMLDGYTPREIVAVLAHEIGHYRHADIARMLAVGGAVAGAGFYLVHRLLQFLLARLPQAGTGGPDDIAGFPVFLFGLFVFSLLTMPLINAYSRRREFRADAYAVRALGEAEPLVSALEKLARQNLAQRDPPRWIEFLLHSHPSIGRRVARARAAAAADGGTGN